MLKKIGRFFVPVNVELRTRRLELMIWAFLLSLSFYPGYFGFLAWFSLARPLMIVSSLKGRQAFNAAYFFAFFFNLFTIYWVALVTVPGMLTAVVIVAFYYTAILMIFNRVYHWKPLYGLIIAPFLWTGVEYFRTLSEFAFPWSDLGYTQSYFLYIIQIVSVISVHGLTFLILAVNVLLWQAWDKKVVIERRLTCFLASAAIVVSLLAFGWVELPKYPVPGKVPIALLQGSVPLDIKWDRNSVDANYRLYDSLTQAVADTSIKLYVWPETAAPNYLSHDATYQQVVSGIVKKSGGYHLIGSLGANVTPQKQWHYNSCYQYSPEGEMQERYDKVKLVPFTEHVPYQDYLPFLEYKFLSKYLTFMDAYDVQWWSDFYPGDTLKIFSLPSFDYVVLICFESTFPEYVRETVQRGAQFLVGITNDTWFKTSVGTHMHSRIFITRAVENRIWGVRAANTGLTYIVDGYGRVREQLPLYQPMALKGNVKLMEGYSIFTRIGDVAGLWSFLITLSSAIILLTIWFIRKFTSKQSD